MPMPNTKTFQWMNDSKGNLVAVQVDAAVPSLADILHETNALLDNVRVLLKEGVLTKPQAFDTLKQFGLVSPEDEYTALPEVKKRGVGFTAEVA